MLVLSAQFLIDRHNGPFVSQRLDRMRTHIEHGFDANGHAGYEPRIGIIASAAFLNIVRNARVFPKSRADTMSRKRSDDGKAICLRIRLYCARDIGDPLAGNTALQAFEKALPRNVHQLLHGFRDLPCKNRHCRVAVVAMNSGADVDLDQIACTDHAFFTGNAVYHFFIDRYTHRSRIAMVIQEARLCLEV